MSNQVTTTRINPIDRAKGQWPGVEPVLANIHIGELQRGLWFRHGRFRELLGPGDYPVLRRPWEPDEDTVEVFDTHDVLFRHPKLDALLSDHAIADALTLVVVPAGELALVWHGERLIAALQEGRHALWRSPMVRVEMFSTREALLNYERQAEAMNNAVVREWLTHEPVAAA